MTYPIIESFQWLEPDFRVNKGTSKNKVIIKGRALFAGVTSKNLRKYVKEELVRAARTLVGKPITVNHDPKRIVGHVIDAEEEDNAIEYVAEVNRKEYAQKLLDRNTMDAKSYHNKWFTDPINGVSVEADYQHTRCSQCGKNFYDIEAFTSHMQEEHKIFNFKLEPHRIFMKALSLVEPPEVPGVPGTTIELMEKAQGMSRLMETLTQDLTEVEKMKKKKKDKPEKVKPATPGYLKTKEDLAILETEVTVTPEVGGDEGSPPPLETPEPPKDTGEPHSCPEGFHYDKDLENCVPDEVMEPPQKPEEPELGLAGSPPPLETMEQDTPTAPIDMEAPTKVEEPTCPEGTHKDPETGACVPDGADLGTEPKSTETPITEIRLPAKLHLGEPFANYTDFDDCVSKNQDKEDPAAYCASIKQKTEGETVMELKETTDIYKAIKEMSNAVIRLGTQAIKRDTKNAEAVNQLNEAIAKWTIQTQKFLKNLNKEILLESRLRGGYDSRIWKRMQELATQAKNITTNIEALRKVAETEISKLTTVDNQVKEHVNKKFSELTTKDTQLKDYTNKKLTELATAHSKLETHVANINKALTPLATKLSKLEEYGKALDALEKQYQDFVKAKEQEEEIPTCPEGEHYDKTQKKCVPNESTMDEIKKLTETVRTRLDNIEAKVKGDFKGHNKPITPQQLDLDEKLPHQ